MEIGVDLESVSLATKRFKYQGMTNSTISPWKVCWSRAAVQQSSLIISLVVISISVTNCLFAAGIFTKTKC